MIRFQFVVIPATEPAERSEICGHLFFKSVFVAKAVWIWEC